MDDGYIKFRLEWKRKALDIDIDELNLWRKRLYDLGLIGAYENGIGFGNISTRIKDTNEFIISGTETGKIKALGPEHYTRVTGFDFDKNTLICEGPIKASSESMTHAAIYSADKNVNAVIHVHNRKLWDTLKDKVPCTSNDVQYGTPEMAYEVISLFKKRKVQGKKLFVMLGHVEGIVSFGNTLMDATKRLIEKSD